MIRSAAILGCAAAALLPGAPALAAATNAPIPAVAAAPDKPRPAESGGHASAATLGPLAIGAAVNDPNGALIGHITRLTTDNAGRSVAKVRQGEDIYTIPVDDLYPRDGAVLSTLTLDTVKHGTVGGP